MPHAVPACRVCGSIDFAPLIGLGDQALTGVFPTDAAQSVTVGPLQLVRCRGACGLVQLQHSYDAAEMYGARYGYRSGLNRSMVDHLHAIVAGLRRLVAPARGDVILDIGSNDGTLLSGYPPGEADLFGMDPSADKFARYYRSDITRVVEFFDADRFLAASSGRRARVVTSIAMFYDLDDPLAFMRQVERVLADDGVWHFEQSYLPLMLRRTAYDTICHEHVEYYALRQIEWMAERAGLKIIDVSLNDTNGGSFAVTAAKAASGLTPNLPAIAAVRDAEDALGLATDAPFDAFADGVRRHRRELPQTLARLKAEGRRVLGYGASTKGNVILQYCGITPDLLPAIAEVNPDKFGCVTPGTHIPIISEADAMAQGPDVLVVFPWHFRDNILRREAEYLRGGGALLFPLPHIELVRA